MKVVRTIAECRAERKGLGRLALVPTMGALHAGHVSLIQEAKKRAQHVAVSIFVNPTQFGPREDFSKYPRPIEEDLARCAAAGVDLVFNPPPEEMYPADEPQVVVDLPDLTSVLEGKHRPGHFRGVCQVVAKLFNVIEPNAACFGQKDFQQLRVLQTIGRDLRLGADIVGCPTVREPDGLAMSSRNAYLTPEQRRDAVALSRGLFAARELWEQGMREPDRLRDVVRRHTDGPGISLEYVSAADPVTLTELQATPADSAVISLAARVGKARLIDNVLLGIDLADLR